MFKTAQDMVWHGSVLEGLCTVAVLQGWSGAEVPVRFSASCMSELTRTAGTHSRPRGLGRSG